MLIIARHPREKTRKSGVTLTPRPREVVGAAKVGPSTRPHRGRSPIRALICPLLGDPGLAHVTQVDQRAVSGAPETGHHESHADDHQEEREDEPVGHTVQGTRSGARPLPRPAQAGGGLRHPAADDSVRSGGAPSGWLVFSAPARGGMAANPLLLRSAALRTAPVLEPTPSMAGRCGPRPPDAALRHSVGVVLESDEWIARALEVNAAAESAGTMALR